MANLPDWHIWANQCWAYWILSKKFMWWLVAGVDTSICASMFSNSWLQVTVFIIDSFNNVHHWDLVFDITCLLFFNWIMILEFVDCFIPLVRFRFKGVIFRCIACYVLVSMLRWCWKFALQIVEISFWKWGFIFIGCLFFWIRKYADWWMYGVTFANGMCNWAIYFWVMRNFKTCLHEKH